MQTAREVIDRDLDFITDQLRTEFAQMAGRNLLVAGGAGFLGHYLVQAALRWNRRHSDRSPICVTVQKGLGAYQS